MSANTFNTRNASKENMELKKAANVVAFKKLVRNIIVAVAAIVLLSFLSKYFGMDSKMLFGTFLLQPVIYFAGKHFFNC